MKMKGLTITSEFLGAMENTDVSQRKNQNMTNSNGFFDCKPKNQSIAQNVYFATFILR